MTPEEQIAALEQQVADLTAAAAGEPARTAAAVAAATAALNAALDTKGKYAESLEAELVATRAERDDAQDVRSAALSALAAKEQELAAYKPPAGSVITPVEFQRRLIPARFRLPYLDDKVRAGWEAVFREVATTFSAVYLTDPLLGGMLAKAVADGVLSQAEADAVKAYTE